MTLLTSLASLLSARGERRSLVRGSVAGFAVRIAAILSGLGSAVVLARVLEPSGYGVYSYAYAIIALVMVPVQLGLPTLILRETARANATQDWPLLRGIWRWSSRAIATGALLAICGVVGWLAFASGDMAMEKKTTLLWGLPLIPLMALSAARASALSGLRLAVRSHFTDQVLRPVALSLFLVIALAFGTIVDPARAMMLHTVAALLSFVAGAILLARARPAALRQTGPHDMKHREWLSALLPLSALTAVQIVNQSADLIMLGIFRSGAEVGVYRIAVSSATFAGIGLTVMGLVFSGHIGHALAKKDNSSLQRFMSAASLVSTATTGAVVLGFVMLGEPLLSLIFGQDYIGAYPALIILASAQLVSGFFGMNGHVLNLAGLERKTLTAFTLSVAVNLVLNFTLIPSYGGFGAGMATLVSTTTWNLLCWGYVRSNLGLDSTFLSARSTIWQRLGFRKGDK